jgi:hypothetical protein
MAKVVTVHGTFAHLGSTGETPAVATADITELQWWQQQSAFEKHARELIKPTDGNLEFVPFEWSGDNSEIDRRKAGSRLLALLRDYESRNEKYALIGHSHGGSVISAALVESTARGTPLEGLRKWITVGTPFVLMKKEPFLFTRLALPRKVLFVASLMLLWMFLFYIGGEIFSDASRALDDNYLLRIVFSGLMMSLPFVVFYFVLRAADARQYYTYRKKPLERARERYASKWLHLYHGDDEAVQGLRVLPRVQLHLFDRDFAIPALTTAAIFALPLIYLLIVTSPTIMVGIADFLKNNVYAVDELQRATGPAADAAKQDMQSLSSRMRQARDAAERSTFDPAAAENARQQVESLRKEMRARREKLRETYPEFSKFERAQRFKRRFLEVDGKPCEGGSLCGGGHDYALNSKLLFHVVTDELASAVVDDGLALGALGGPLRLLLPIVLVPLAFGALALGILALIQLAASRISSAASGWLNRLTLAEIRRSAFGNDTEGEIALGAECRPYWAPPEFRELPDEIGDKISDFSNGVTAKSLSKFRNAISTLAFSEGSQSKSGLISSYLTWKELIHTAYFEVPEFRKLMAQAIVQTEGFEATDRFKADPDFESSKKWLAALEPVPHAPIIQLTATAPQAAV